MFNPFNFKKTCKLFISFASSYYVCCFAARMLLFTLEKSHKLSLRRYTTPKLTIIDDDQQLIQFNNIEVNKKEETSMKTLHELVNNNQEDCKL
jgi:hypothetical protein